MIFDLSTNNRSGDHADDRCESYSHGHNCHWIQLGKVPCGDEVKLDYLGCEGNRINFLHNGEVLTLWQAHPDFLKKFDRIMTEEGDNAQAVYCERWGVLALRAVEPPATLFVMSVADSEERLEPCRNKIETRETEA